MQGLESTPHPAANSKGVVAGPLRLPGQILQTMRFGLFVSALDHYFTYSGSLGMTHTYFGPRSLFSVFALGYIELVVRV